MRVIFYFIRLTTPIDYSKVILTFTEIKFYISIPIYLRNFIIDLHYIYLLLSCWNIIRFGIPPLYMPIVILYSIYVYIRPISYNVYLYFNKIHISTNKLWNEGKINLICAFLSKANHKNALSSMKSKYQISHYNSGKRKDFLYIDN